MTNDERNPKPECRRTLSCAVAGFVIRASDFFRHSFGFRHSSFGFKNCSLFNQKAGQRTGESGRGLVGSWKVQFCPGVFTRRLHKVDPAVMKSVFKSGPSHAQFVTSSFGTGTKSSNPP